MELTLFLPSKMLLYCYRSFVWEGLKCLKESVGEWVLDLRGVVADGL